MNNWVCEARDCRWHSKAVICLDVLDCFYSLMGTLPIKARFTASLRSCKDVAFFFFLFKWQRLVLDDEWHRTTVAAMFLGLRQISFCISASLNLFRDWPSFHIFYVISGACSMSKVSFYSFTVYNVTFHIMYQNIISVAHLKGLSREGKNGVNCLMQAVFVTKVCSNNPWCSVSRAQYWLCGLIVATTATSVSCVCYTRVMRPSLALGETINLTNKRIQRFLNCNTKRILLHSLSPDSLKVQKVQSMCWAQELQLARCFLDLFSCVL